MIRFVLYFMLGFKIITALYRDYKTVTEWNSGATDSEMAEC